MKTKDIIDVNSKIKAAANLVSADLEGETALMSVAQGKYYGLERVGSRVWALLETPRSVSEICTVLMTEFEVDRQRCEKDLLKFVNELAEENLIEVVDEPSAKTPGSDSA